ncbi:hypothetical protein OJF2_29850 [Aquisphaera giovannonii]|uniref:Uncharacterized protein n=1 Tax=Aquisphaera giovannonii TaxID=406548 RepID=A0A5B9W1I3_9BACT|nr:hypothetical protein OJF2_29850 [Aquisphaera giovannonii]
MRASPPVACSAASKLHLAWDGWENLYPIRAFRTLAPALSDRERPRTA